MSQCRYIILVIGLFCLLPPHIDASVKTWRQLTTDNGLLSNHVHSVDVDDDGVIWMGTRYGIMSYDGNRVVAHLPLSAHTSPKMYNDIPDLVPMDDGRIYFITSLVFGVYDKHRDRFTPIQIDGAGSYRTLCRIGRDKLLVGGMRRLIEYDTSTGEYRDLPDGGEGAVLTMQDRIGQIWVVTSGQGLFRYSPHERRMYHVADIYNIECLYQDSNDKIYVGTRGSGLYMVNNPYSLSECSLDRVAEDVLKDGIPVFSVVESVNDGQLWIGTDGGILSVNAASFLREDMRQGLNTGRVTKLWADSTGIIWAATSGAGIFFMDTAPALFDSGKSLRPEMPKGWSNTLAVYEDSRGVLWSGCLTHPLLYNQYGEPGWHSPYDEFGIARHDMPEVFSIGEDLSGNMYFGSYGSGILRLNMVTGDAERLAQPDSEALPDSRVMRIKTDSHGNVWVGTIAGFGVIMADGLQRTMSTRGDVMGICEKNGRVYVATLNDGIFSVAIDSVSSGADVKDNSRVTVDDGFQPVILSIASSPTRNLVYVGTEDEGLWTFNTQTGEYSLTDYVPRHCNLQVAFIHEDKRGFVWIATNRGLYRVNSSDESDRIRYTVYDGLDNDYFVYNGMATESRLYLPTIKGLEIIDMESTYTDTCRTVPVRFGFTEMHFNNRRFEELVPEDRERISGDKLPVYNRQMTIPQDLNNFSIEFAAYDYRNPDLVSFSYMLEGYDGGWQQPLGGHLSATYTNLPSGNYRFRLRAGGGNGHWGDEEKVIHIRILPPWYLSWAALCVYAVIVVITIFCFIRIVHRREQEKARLQLMRQEKESFEELNRTKLRFFTNITHELLTPLTVISASISELRKGDGDLASLCRIAEVNVSKLVRLLQQILEFRKVETDNIRLRVSYGDIRVFVANTVEALRPLTLKQSMKLELKLPDGRMMGYFDSDKLDKILYNLVSNATKYSGPNGVITVEASASDDGGAVVIKVSDTGRGIPKSKQANLFKRFYDGDYREHNTSGTGIGLSLTKDLVELSHGTIEVDSDEGKGTSFIVTLPITAGAFGSDEIASVLSDTAVENTAVDSGQSENDKDFTDSSGSACEGMPRRKILIIEDNEDLLHLMKQVIGRTYEVVAESDGRSGLEAALRDVPDLIITDLTMPGIDGLEIIRRLREDDRTSTLPIVVLTARRQDEDRRESYEAGADVYLPKPFDISVLKACISTQLNSHKRDDGNGRLVIDLKKYDYEPADMQLLKLATEVVERNLDKSEFDIPTFAKEVGLSQTHLFRKLKELTDMSPTHFIRTTRLRVAARILAEHPDIRIGEIAFMVGFSDARYFGICFKKEFGVTPGEYKADGR